MISRELAQTAAQMLEEMAKHPDPYPYLNSPEVKRFYRGQPVEFGPTRREKMKAIAQELRRQA